MRLKGCIAAKGLTQREFGQRLKVSESAVSNWISGRQAPDLHRVPLIARTLGLSADELLEGLAVDAARELADDAARSGAHYDRAADAIESLGADPQRMKRVLRAIVRALEEAGCPESGP